MNRIDLWRLRALIQQRLWRDTFVSASPLGGWFLARRRVA